MQCTRCYTHMQLVKRENHQSSFLEWHQCPLCRRMEFIAEPIHNESSVADHDMHLMAGHHRLAYS